MALLENNPLAEPGRDETSTDERLKQIFSKWGDVELLLERMGKQDELVSELQNYISDLRAEASIIGRMRKFMVAASIAYVIFVNMLLLCMLFYHQIFFLVLGNYGKTALIVGVFSSSVVLVVKILAGLFRTHGDRNKDDVLPPHVKALIETYGAIKAE